MKKLLGKYWFFIGIIAMVCIAIYLPFVGMFVKTYKILSFGIFISFLLTGLTLTVSYLVWAGYFAAKFPMAFIPAIAYHLTQMVMDTFVAHWFRRKSETAKLKYEIKNQTLAKFNI